MNSFVTVALLSLAVSGSARAASPEDDYLAARRSHLAEIGAAERVNRPETELLKLDAAGVADLAGRMSAVVGTSAFPAVPPTPVYRPETLLGGQLESGTVDGLRYASETGERAYLVTTEKIVLTWAGAAAADSPALARAMRSGLGGLFAEDEFLTHAIGVDAAFEGQVDLPVRAGPGVVVRARAGVFAQDTAFAPPTSLVVALVENGRVTIATAPIETGVADPKACAGFKRKAGGRYVACVVESLKHSPQFAALGREAQDLLDALRAR